MLFKDIKEISKNKKVKVFFDMDGVLVEYRAIKEKDFDKVGFYAGLRPIKTSIKFAKKLSNLKNVDVCILSNCRKVEHKKDKYKWLYEFMPFLKQENINIICYDEIPNFNKEDKKTIKSERILKMQEREDFIAYHIEDDTNIIKVEKEIESIRIIHISTLIK